MTLLVLKLEKLIKFFQWYTSKSILIILITFSILKLEIFNFIKEEHPQNILFILVNLLIETGKI